MNPETELSNAFAQSLKITDQSPTNPGLRRKWTALQKTLQQRKEEAEHENAVIQKQLNDVVQKLTKLRVSSPALTKVVPTANTRKRTIRDVENPLNPTKSNLSKTKRRRFGSPTKTT
jgi:hypothetical protein